MPDTLATQWAPRALSLLRIVAGFMFIAHGTMKYFGFPMAGPGGPPAVFSMIGVAGLLEIVGGVLVMIGLFTRISAFVLSGLMAAAYFIAHAPQGFWPIVNKGELAALYSFVFLYLAAAGGGSWSLDRWLRNTR